MQIRTVNQLSFTYNIQLEGVYTKLHCVIIELRLCWVCHKDLHPVFEMLQFSTLKNVASQDGLS